MLHLANLSGYINAKLTRFGLKALESSDKSNVLNEGIYVYCSLFALQPTSQSLVPKTGSKGDVFPQLGETRPPSSRISGDASKILGLDLDFLHFLSLTCRCVGKVYRGFNFQRQPKCTKSSSHPLPRLLVVRGLSPRLNEFVSSPFVL